MINRTLIRLKVVQLLYAHLLSRIDFKVLTTPQRDTLEAKDIFTIYVNALAILALVTGQKAILESYPRLGHKVLDRSKITENLITRLIGDEDIRKIISGSFIDKKMIDDVTPVVYDKLITSNLYNDYSRKKKATVEEEIKFWESVILTIIAPSLREYVVSHGAHISEYAITTGCQEAKKVVENYGSIRTAFVEAKKELDISLDNTRELYLALLVLPVELVKEREQQLDNAKNKYLPSPDDLNPNTRLIDSEVVKKLAENEDIKKFIEDNPLYWSNESSLMKNLLNDLISSPLYSTYIQSDTSSYKNEVDFWVKAFEKIILPSDSLIESMENKSVYWNDDVNIVASFVVKTLKASVHNENEEIILEPKFRNDEDEEFGNRLFDKAFLNYIDIRNIIDRHLSKEWELERIAFMDIIILVAAIAEILYFPQIPLPVTMNEYTDITTYYSTGRSSQFVNGILVSVANELKENNKILK